MKIILSVVIFSIPFFCLAQANFNAPDTICIKTPLHITNTSRGAVSNYWNFCVANLNEVPGSTNLGNINGMLNAPVFMDYVFTNNKYYASYQIIMLAI
jgi:hypothetical protein